MFYINDRYVTKENIDQAFTLWKKDSVLRNVAQLKIAVCLESVEEWLSFCLYVRSNDGMVLPLHSSLPRGGAIELASRLLVLWELTSRPLSDGEIENKSREIEGGLLQFSSGTTGVPKQIKRTWSSIKKEVKAYNKLIEADVKQSRKTIIACPVTHSYGLISGFLSTVSRKEEPIILQHSNPKTMIQVLKKYPNHLLYASPPLLYTLARFLSDGENLDHVMTSGTILDERSYTTILSKSKRVLQQYGCSEVGCISINTNVKDRRNVGMPLSHVNVESGTIETPASIIVRLENGETETKDIGYIQEGNLFFISREDDMINMAGLNVYPYDVEEVMLKHPFIQDAVVFKKPHPIAGERVHGAFVTTGESITPQELREWMSQYLASHQMPVEMKQINQIEREANGKLNRRKIREMIG
ncbi:hypothetical protein Q75_09335 [Bacillus coahuilensis p1.1.43]|uniref:Acyl-CoA synthase n=1 Tax=Bacillus coahuilensis p1.1.43 TaxID=1150625 RepID=A0A147K7P0_9BACI|nr:AMP-binding protein [Bacillus coahuilensis]KUP06134.1 hypothetical protein Q75_09335 [Bacillus coahuilensis p1.1.43]